MTGMEHVIEQATERAERVLAPHFRNVALGGVEDDTHLGALVLRAVDALAEAGLLAPAPLREEWAVEGTLDSGDDWIADCEFATRLGAEDFLNSNEWARRDGGHVSRRYFTDWLPADRAEGDGSADQ